MFAKFLKCKKGIARKTAIMVLIAVIIVVAVIGGAYFYTRPPPGPTEILIGSMFELSGTYAEYGALGKEAVEMAIADINAAGGIKSLGGVKLRAIHADIKSNPQVAMSETERVATTYKISAFVGAYVSSLTVSASTVSERYGIPWVTGCVADIITARGFKYIFRVTPTGTVYGTIMADYLKDCGEKFGYPVKRVAILYEDTAYGMSAMEGISEYSLKIGLPIVFKESYSAGFTDAVPLITKVKAANPDALICCSYFTDMVLIVKALKELDFSVPIITTGQVPEFCAVLGKSAEYISGVYSWSADLKTGNTQDLRKRWEAEHPGETMPMEVFGENYAIVWVIKEAIEKAASADPQKVRDALAMLDIDDPSDPANILPGARVKFDSTGQNIYAELVICQWQNGKCVSVYPFEVAVATAWWSVPPWTERP